MIRSFGSTPDKLAASKAHCRVDEPNRPLISVIVPVLNEAAAISRCALSKVSWVNRWIIGR